MLRRLQCSGRLIPPPCPRLRRTLSASAAAAQLPASPAGDLFWCNSMIRRLAGDGRVGEARKVFDEMVQRDSVSWNSMISGYALNGCVEEARALFDAFAGKDVRSWTAMITCYAKNGQVDCARRVFEQMPVRNVVSWNAMVSGYLQNGDIGSARRLFSEMPVRDVASWNTMITGYCHVYQLSEARVLFDQMPERNLMSWSVMISGYAQCNNHSEAWLLFCRMRQEGVIPDQFSLVVTVTAVCGLNNMGLLEILRTLAIKLSLESDVVVGTAILDSYTRCGKLDIARKFFAAMPERNDFTWTTMISALSQSSKLEEAVALFQAVPVHTTSTQTAMLAAYADNGKIREAKCIFDRISEPSVITWNAMLAGYMRNGMIREADECFSLMPSRNIASWGTMIAGNAHHGRNREALGLLAELHRFGLLPSQSCFTTAFFACANVQNLEMGRQIHALTIKTSMQMNSFVGNGLITMYAKCQNTDDVTRVFRKMKIKDVVSWNSLLSGLSQNSLLDEARNVFMKMPQRDVVSWTSIISAYVQAEMWQEALELYVEMLSAGIEPNSSTISTILSACASLGSTILGKQIHALCYKLGMEGQLFVSNALISMYFRCGSLDSFNVFDETLEQDVVTWNSLLTGAAQHGYGKLAIEIFEQMKSEGVKPNEVSFLGLLCACSHEGLVKEGQRYFDSMIRDYGLVPVAPHYACMVDLLGRAGYLYKALEVIEDMPVEPDSVVWGVLLSACRTHKNMELGRIVAERLFQMDPQNSGNYILLSNIYASLGMWVKVGEIRKLMRDRGVVKEPGFSWMYVKNQLHSFVIGDQKHERSNEIYSKLKEIYGQLKVMGYIPDTNFVLHDVEEEQKEDVLLYHSEKLAIAFGLLSIPEGSPIEIMKNLRTCGDCHNFAKFLSKILKRRISIRDGSRFHHFNDGFCSCGDYW